MKYQINKIGCAVAVLIFFLFGACRTAEFHHTQIDVHGMVYDFENRPVAGYSVELDRTHSAVTDAMGRYAFQSVPSGEYTLIGQRQGYERYETMVSVNSRTEIQYLRVASAEQLLSLADEKLSNGDLPAAADYVTRAENTESRSILIPFYAAVISFRNGKPNEALSILRALEDRGVRDIYIDKMKREFTEISGGGYDTKRK